MTTASRRRLLRASVAMLVGLLSLELGCRVFWRVAAGIPLLAPGRFVQVFYPQLKRFHFPREDSPEAFDVLVLGASVLHEEYGAFEEVFTRELRARTDRPVHVFNLSTPSHTSRDSLHKYRYAAERVDFELVVVYHGINELRANNAPPELFRADYGHYGFNRLTNAYFDHPILLSSSLAATAYYGLARLTEHLGLARTVPRGRPRDEWLAHGAEVKSAATLRRNLEAIVTDAGARGTPLLLMSYAWYIPPDYTKAAFDAKELDYGTFQLPVELWGTVANVRRGLELHNEVVREVARAQGCLFVDQDALLPKDRTVFNDVCHLTRKGSELFVANLLAAVEPLL